MNKPKILEYSLWATPSKVLFYSILLVGGFICKKPLFADPPAQAVWEETFHDDFSGTELDTSRWNKGLGWGDGTSWFREWCAPENVSVENGQLIFKLEKRSPNPNPWDKLWASGCVNTKNKFFQEFGYYEARIKIAKGKGFLNAFWMKRNTEVWPPEIDIVEIVGPKPSTAFMTVHFDKGAGPDESGGTWDGPDFSQDFHTFGVWWKKDEVIWYVDGIERRRTSEGSAFLSEPFYMMLNVHIGGIEWMGDPDSTTLSPSFFVTDWVTAFKWVRDKTPEEIAGLHSAKPMEAMQSSFRFTLVDNSFKIWFPKAEIRTVFILKLDGTLLEQQSGFKQEYNFAKRTPLAGIYLVNTTTQGNTTVTSKIVVGQ